MTQNQYSKAFAATLKAAFPALGTDDDMNGADAVESLADLYEISRRGDLALPKAHKVTTGKIAEQARSMAARRWAIATEAQREALRLNGQKGGRPRKTPANGALQRPQ